MLIMLEKIIRANDNNESTIGVMIDFSKAFDTVNHGILLRKLDCYGVRGNPNSWLKSYLTNRSQTTTYNNVKSSVKYMSHGVPQGSILGPLLFLTYINDIGFVTKNSQLLLFADDSNLFVHGRDLEVMEKKLMRNK